MDVRKLLVFTGLRALAFHVLLPLWYALLCLEGTVL